MQPYFIPYAGYFSLIASVDLFVVYDCVQFPRRGWVHRNKMPDNNGNEQWITLPLKKCPQETIIRDLEFSENANELWLEQLKKFPQIDNKMTENLTGTPVDYISMLLGDVCKKLDIPFNFEHSKNLDISEDLRGEDRILAIAKHFEATDYVNASGGTELYDKEKFESDGIDLHFLPEYNGNTCSIAHRLATEDHVKLREEIYANSI